MEASEELDASEQVASEQVASEQQASTGLGPRVGRLVMIVILLAGIGWAVANRDSIDPQLIRQFVDSLGMWGAATFVALYVIAALFFLPGSAMTLAAGALFGAVQGTLLALVGATLGAAAAFVVARYVAGGWVRQKVSGRLETVVKGVEAEGWKFVAFTRLVPIFPYNLLNYAFGLTRIKLGHFTLASFVTMLPGAAAYAYLGHAGQQLAAGTENAIQTAFIALGALAALGLISTVLKRYKKQKQKMIGQEEFDDLLAGGMSGWRERHDND
ncbi:MAG: TVP38/TMEM64 family protein [Persicimonas sp.]